MDSRQANNPQLERERVVYDYLEALENGDIDSIIASLQRAMYDAPLDEMLMDAHQAYFQDEQAQQAALTEANTHEMPVLEAATLRSRGKGQRNRAGGRRIARWMQALAAVLILGVLVGSFIAILSLRKGGQSASPGLTPTSACQPYTLKQANVPVPANSSGSLGAVASVSADDVWAVGYAFPHSSTFGTTEATALIEHWNGKSWQIAQSPNGANGSGQLSAVAAISADNVWAVGASPGHTRSDPDHTLIEHWNGEKWQVVPSPNGPTGSGALTSLSAVSANDIWAVGNFSDAQQISHPLLERWNGTSWQTVTLSGGGASADVALISVAAISANDVWAVGQSDTVDSQNVIMHWNGISWYYTTMLRGISSISAISAHDIWITNLGAQGWEADRFDGESWRSDVIPFSGAIPMSIRQIHAVSDNDIWAVGNISGTSSNTTSLAVWHWNGKAWQQFGIPAQLSSRQADSAGYGIAVSGNQRVWIVGELNNSPLILGQQSCP